MNITDLFHSIDLWNNKIFRAKCETPEQDEHIVNKKYVDDITTYDTEKAQRYQNPFLQWWMKNVYGKTFKELFDDLLFPRIAPEYKNPSFESLTLMENGENLFGTLISNNILILPVGMSKNFTFEINLDPGDRTSTKRASLTITYPEEYALEKLTFYSESTNSSFVINAPNVPIRKGMTFEISKEYGAASPKNDTYGEPSIPDEFTKDYTFTKDISSLFFDKVNLVNPLLVKKTNTLDPIEIVPESTNELGSLTENGFVVSDILQYENGTMNYYDVLVPKEFLNCIFKVLLYSNNYLISKLEFSIDNVCDINNINFFKIQFEDSSVSDYFVTKFNLGYGMNELSGKVLTESVFNNLNRKL